MAPLKLLSVEETVAAAAAACARANQEPFDPRRALTGLSSNAIVSMVVLVGQLDGVAQAAARAEALWHPDDATPVDAEAGANASAALIRLLLAAGYLPLPSPDPATPAPETDHGQG